MQDRIFYGICFGFIFGVLISSFVFVNFYLNLLFLIISLVLFLFFSFISKNNWGIIFSIFVLTFSFGIFRFSSFNSSLDDSLSLYGFNSFLNQKVSFVGQIVDEPSVGEKNQKLIVELSSIKDKAKILLNANLDTDYKYGDEVRFTGALKKPENFITDQGKVFDYVNYLRKDGILFIMSYPKIEIASRGHGSFIQSWLFRIKENFLEKINLVISSPENIFMGGLILGEKSSFSQELRTQFINTGTIHIVALSGYNVTIVAEWLMSLLLQVSFVSINFAISAGILSIILFIIMTGGGSTALRAGIMSVLALIAKATNRNYDVYRALILSAFFMILVNPLTLVYDVSFQLSFLATIAVIFLSPRIEKYFLWITENFGLRDVVTVTVAAYVFVFPFILYKMGNFSLVALPANTLILPFIPFTMLLGFITGFVGMFWYVLSMPFGYVSYLFLHYELGVISLFARLPFASLSFPDFPLFLTIIIYVYFVYKLFGRNIKKFFIASL